MSKSVMVIAGLLALSSFSTTVWAGEAEDVAVGMQCIEAKKIVKTIRKTDGLKADKVKFS